MVASLPVRDHRHIAISPPPPTSPGLPPSPGPPPPPGGHHPRPARLTRSSSDKMISGVCGGLGRWLGVEPMIVRIAFVVLAISGGAGVVAYAVLWVAVPDDRGKRGLDAMPSMHATAAFGRDHGQRAVAVFLLLLGGLLLVRESGLWAGDRLVWPVALAGFGLALAWPVSASAAVRRGLGVESRAAVLRVGLGVAVATGGVVFFAVANGDWQDFSDVLLAVLLTIAGLLLVFGPWWWRLGRDLVEERRARIRSEERAEVAARIHDSVLQTLALIQRRAGDSAETARLARRQERELRQWLFQPAATLDGATLRTAIADAAAEVEDLYDAVVEVVVVGDAPLDPALEALVGAAREAMVNAAKFAGTGAVDVYAEVGDSNASVFVRDRGRGFDPDHVPDDRQGIAESIRGRMTRNGGRAEVRSREGEGTEVELVLPRARR